MAKDYTKQYEVLYRDVDRNLKCKLSTMVDIFCDVGNAHAESVGDSIDFQLSHGCTWVFYKYDITIHKYPKYRDKLNVTTIAVGFKKFYAFRKYLIKNEEGEVLAEALALFFLINIEKRRPARILKEQYKFYGEDGDMDKALEMEKIQKIEKEDYYKEFQIRYSDIDSNKHVNNVNYTRWALEAIPVEILYEYELSELSVVFEKECSYGEEIKSICEIKETEEGYFILHKIENIEGKELATLISKWKK